MVETWDETKPSGSRAPALGDDDMRELKRAERERLAEDHVFEATENPAFGAPGGYKIGKHKYVTLVAQATAKTTAADELCLRSKDIGGGAIELVLTPKSAGTDRQLTKSSGANFNLNSGDFNDGCVPTSGLADLAVTTAKINDLAVTAAKLGAAAVETAKIADLAVSTAKLADSAVDSNKLAAAAVTALKLGSFESAGDSDYFANGFALGGYEFNTLLTSYVTLLYVRCVLPGTYRFYWGYKEEDNNHWGYFKVLKNGALLLGEFSDYGTSSGDPYHYRTDDLVLAAGDTLQFMAHGSIGDTEGAFIRVYLRGSTLKGLCQQYNTGGKL